MKTYFFSAQKFSCEKYEVKIEINYFTKRRMAKITHSLSWSNALACYCFVPHGKYQYMYHYVNVKNGHIICSYIIPQFYAEIPLTTSSDVDFQSHNLRECL